MNCVVDIFLRVRDTTLLRIVLWENGYEDAFPFSHKIHRKDKRLIKKLS